MARAYVIYPAELTHEEKCTYPTREESEGLTAGSYSDCQSCSNVFVLTGWMMKIPLWKKVSTFEEKRAWKKFKDAR